MWKLRPSQPQPWSGQEGRNGVLCPEIRPLPERLRDRLPQGPAALPWPLWPASCLLLGLVGWHRLSRKPPGPQAELSARAVPPTLPTRASRACMSVAPREPPGGQGCPHAAVCTEQGLGVAGELSLRVCVCVGGGVQAALSQATDVTELPGEGGWLLSSELPHSPPRAWDPRCFLEAIWPLESKGLKICITFNPRPLPGNLPETVST